MNKYLSFIVSVTCGLLNMATTKFFNLKSFKGTVICRISPSSEITLDPGGYLEIGKKLIMRDCSKIRVRKEGRCFIGKKVFFNSNSMITCHEWVEIGDNVQLSPNVQIYDHDHDFRVGGD